MGNQCCQQEGEQAMESIDTIPALSPSYAEAAHGKEAMDMEPATITMALPAKETGDSGEQTPQSRGKVQEVIATPPKKQTIQAQVRGFVKELIKGMDVQVLTNGQDQDFVQLPATCSLDADVKRLRVAGAGENIECALASICNVFQIEDGKSAFPPKVLEIVASEEHERLLMITYALGGDDAKKAAVFMVTRTAEERQRFNQCTKALVSLSRSKGGK